MKGQIVQFLLNQGFDQVRVTTSKPPAGFSHYQQWIDKGLHADLDWMTREDRVVRRENPAVILPEAKSIILVAVSFGEIDLKGRADSGIANLSGYALRPDYHKIIDKKLKQAVKLLQREFGANSRFSVDYGAVLERDLAERAGLGYIGKSTMLISPSMGTSFFIGEILTTLELEPDDNTVALHCGGCTRCITGCPTGALEEYSLDCAKCISYLTIEFKGVIPVELRALMGNHIFGCDVCQQVCPQNFRRDSEFAPNATHSLRPFWNLDEGGQASVSRLSELKLSELILLSAEEFDSLFRLTPVKRAGYECLMRNVAVALGNSKALENIPILEQALGKISPLVDEHIEWAIGYIAD